MTIENSHVSLRPVQVHFLEMQQRPVSSIPAAFGLDFRLWPKPIPVEEYRKFYYGVGRQWYWLDRMLMEDGVLAEKINAANVDIYVLHIEGQPAGFAEFVREDDYVEILYFGLLPDFIGKGYGHYFLQTVIQQAWDYQPKHIQLNTCELDHPNALNVYRKAGFQLVRTDVEDRKILR